MPNMLLEISGSNSRKNEEMETKQKLYPDVDVTGMEAKSNALRAVFHRNLEF